MVRDVRAGDGALGRGDRGQLLLAHEAVEQLRVVHDLELDAELLVLVLERVEAVGTGRDDLLDLGLLERLDVLHRELLEHDLVAGATRGVTRAGLAVAQHRERHARHVEQLGDGLRGLLGAVLVGAGAADPEEPLDLVEVLDVDADLLDLEVEAVGPLQPVLRAHVPGIALALQALEDVVQLGREVRLHEHLVAAHVVDVVDVLDVDGALLHAGAAVRARPQDVGVDDAVDVGVTDERTLELGDLRLGALVLGDLEQRDLGVGVLAQAHHEQLRGERLLGVPRGALALATTALGAGREVQETLPGEVLDLADAELVEVVLVEVLELLQVEGLAADVERREATERRAAVGLALEPDVEPRGEAVPGDAHRDVAGDHDQPDHREHDLEHRDEEDDVLQAVLAGRAVQGVTHVPAEGEVEASTLLGLAGQLEELVLGAADEQDRRALEERHDLDEVGLPERRAVEAAAALEAARVVPLAHGDQVDDADRAQDPEALGDPLVEEEVADDRPRELGIGELEVRLQDRRGEHEERRVDEPVHDTDDGELALRHPRVEEGLLEHRERALDRLVTTSDDRLTGLQDAHELPRGEGDHRDGDSRHENRHDDGDELHQGPTLHADSWADINSRVASPRTKACHTRRSRDRGLTGPTVEDRGGSPRSGHGGGRTAVLNLGESAGSRGSGGSRRPGRRWRSPGASRAHR